MTRDTFSFTDTTRHIDFYRTFLFYTQRYGRKIFTVLSVTLLIVSLPTLVFLANSPDRFDLLRTNFSQIALRNEDLAKQLADLSTASPNERSKKLNDLLETAKNREKDLKRTLMSDPGKFLENAMNEDIADTLPPEVKEHVEQEVEVSGELAMVTFEGDNQSALAYNLSSASDSFNLHFVSGAPVVPSASVTLSGVQLGSEIVLESGDPLSGSAFGISSLTVSSFTAQESARVLVLLVTFANSSAADEVVTRDQASTLVFSGASSLASYMSEVSYGRVAVAGDVRGYVKIDANAEGCYQNYADWTTKANQKALDEGTNPENYAHVFYVFARNSNCNWRSASTLGSSPSKSWIFSYQTLPSMYYHVFLRNYGLGYAEALTCGNKSIASYSECAVHTRGDRYDALGAFGSRAHVNAAIKHAMGWDIQVQSVEQSGEFTLSPLEIAGGIQALRIPKVDTGEYYYIEYRQPRGFDSSLASGITSGALVHIGTGDRTQPTRILDLTPGTTGEDEAFRDTLTFIDSGNQLTIRQKEHNSQGVTVSVSLGSSSIPSPRPTPLATPQASGGGGSSPGPSVPPGSSTPSPTPTLPAVKFATRSSSGSEGTTLARIEVVLTEALQVDVTVDFEVTGGTAIKGTDFKRGASTLRIPAGQTSKDITVTILEDTLQEGNETIDLTLSNPVNARLGRSVHTLTITDND